MPHVQTRDDVRAMGEGDTGKPLTASTQTSTSTGKHQHKQATAQARPHKSASCRAHLRLAAVLGGVGHAAGAHQYCCRSGQSDGAALLEEHANQAAGQHPQGVAVALAAANLLALCGGGWGGAGKRVSVPCGRCVRRFNKSAPTSARCHRVMGRCRTRRLPLDTTATQPTCSLTMMSVGARRMRSSTGTPAAGGMGRQQRQHLHTCCEPAYWRLQAAQRIAAHAQRSAYHSASCCATTTAGSMILSSSCISCSRQQLGTNKQWAEQPVPPQARTVGLVLR